jgi:hypothetical protein
MQQRADIRATMPPTLVPRGLTRLAAAAYVGLSATSFDAMVAAGAMPKPRIALPTRRKLYDRFELDAAFAALPHQDDEVSGDTWADYDAHQAAVR